MLKTRLAICSSPYHRIVWLFDVHLTHAIGEIDNAIGLDVLLFKVLEQWIKSRTASPDWVQLNLRY